MARIRSVHPGLFTDDAFVQLSDAAQVFLIGLWTECDDQGAFEWNPVKLRLKLRGCRDGGVDPLLSELESVDCIKKYTHNGKAYGAVRNFNKWQRPKKPSHVYLLPDDLREYVGILTDEEDRALALRKAKFDEAGGKCFYCGTEVTYYSKRHNSMELDHFIPKAKGGSDDPSNLRCACRSCNRSKCDMDAKEFFAWLSQRDENAKEKLRKANERFASTNPPQTPLMEEGGGRRLEGGDNLSLARENARAPEPKADVREGDPPHWATVQTLLKRPDDLDQWETDFLHSIKWAQTLTKPQREKLDTITARMASAPPPDATPTPPKPRVLVFVDTDQWKAWRDHLLGQGKRAPNPLDLKDEHHRLIGRGWYFDSEWPPPASDAAA